MMKKIIAVIMSIALCFNLCTFSLAAGESNNKGITFSVSLNKSSIPVDSGEQIIVMTLEASSAVTSASLGFKIVHDDALTLVGVEKGPAVADFAGGVQLDSSNAKYGQVNWYAAEDANLGTQLAMITFTVPAGIAAGDYNVGVEAIELSEDYTVWESTASASTTLTVERVAVEGYSASISATATRVTVGKQATIYVAVEHSEEETFAATEFEVEYDTTRLAFNENASSTGTAKVVAANGVLTIADYGADKNAGTGVYTLVFDAMTDGEAVVTLTSAAFSNKVAAERYDLTPATILNSTVAMTIAKASHTVTLPEGMIGPDGANDNASYTFSLENLADYNNYTYTVTATMNGQLIDVTDNGNGTFTIDKVTGNLEIEAERVAKSYNVTFSGTGGNDVQDGEATATYGKEYSFTLPTLKGYVYKVESITMGTENYADFIITDSVVTISGADIKGNMVINVSKTAVDIPVTVEGNGAGAANGYTPTVKYNEPYTLTLVPEKGYNYTVTAIMGEESATVNRDGNSYTIEKVTAALAFTVTKTVKTGGVSVAQDPYRELNGTNLWLVLNNDTDSLDTGKVWAYNGVAMYWSDEYEAYCYLVVAPTLTTEDAKANVSIIDGAREPINYSYDVNDSGNVDANDAQLVYNMYNQNYSGFTTNVTMWKYLLADVNGDQKVNVEDAAMIIDAICAR